MSDYTIKNLGETPDSAPKFGFAELGEAHFPREELDAKATGMAYHVLKPGKRNAFGHRHQNAEEVYVVIAGSGRVRLDDEVREIARLDAIRVAPEIVRAFEAGPDGLEVLVFGAHHEKDGELLPDFWKE
jgi:quercetin dioxygenase-like cupin family protein